MTDIVVPGAVDALPVAPDPSTDSVLEFDAKANAMVAAQKTMVAQINDVAAKTRQNAIAANERATSADSAKQSAQTAATQAASAATQASSAAATATNKASEASSSADTARQYAQSIYPVALKDRANHTGTQAISTVSGLQAALDSKETPAGALAQMRGFGLGSSVVNAPSVANIQSLNALNSGIYRSTSANIADSPGGNTTGFFINLPYLDTGEGTARLFVTRDDPPRLFTRLSSAAAWLPWAQIAPVASPAFTGTPSAPSLKLGNVASTDVNTLDYYEEGTFTPTLEGSITVGAATYSNRQGRYTRIGNRVLWSVRISLSSKGGLLGDLIINGLPFIPSSNSGVSGGISIGVYQNLITQGITLFGQHVAASPQIWLNKAAFSGAATTVRLTATDIQDNFVFFASGQYEV